MRNAKGRVEGTGEEGVVREEGGGRGERRGEEEGEEMAVISAPPQHHLSVFSPRLVSITQGRAVDILRLCEGYVIDNFFF